jgi:hypothetical protein
MLCFGVMQELEDEIAAEEAARQEHRDTRHKLNLARCDAEQMRAQALVHIQELSAEVKKVRADLQVAMETMVRERNAKNEYRIKQDAMTNKVRRLPGLQGVGDDRRARLFYISLPTLSRSTYLCPFMLYTCPCVGADFSIFLTLFICCGERCVTSHAGVCLWIFEVSYELEDLIENR